MRSSAPRTLFFALAAGVVGYLVGLSGPEEGASVRRAPTEQVIEDPWDKDGRPAGEADDPEPDGTDDVSPGAASAGEDALRTDLSDLPVEVLGERALQQGEIVGLPQGDYVVRADGKGKLVLKKHGLWKEPLKKGTRREGAYRDGKRNGVWRWWHANGQLWHTGEWRDGKAVGAHRIWNASGKLAEARQYENGRGTGNWTWWHSNGQRRREGRMENGKRVGAWTTWHA
ncbi:MAG: hypothetical protein ACYS6Z_04775, partial [Planctomycetota bacterium]